MAYIYQITNDINGKIYIGKTERTVEERFKEHCRDAYRREFEKRPLYSAMRKYGVEHFHVETLEETDLPEEREIYWIETKRSFKNGYNATLGGDGKHYIDYDLVLAMYAELKNQKEVARRMNINEDTVHTVLTSYQVDILDSASAAALATGKVINQYDLQDNYIQSFPSAKAAAESLNKITATSNGASSHISDVCRGKRKTAYGYKWKFANISVE
jgi:hypothetical protein